MYTDDQNRQSNGQNGFVRRNMANPRFDGEKPAPSYQNNGSDYSQPSTPSYGGGYSGYNNSSPRPPYNPQARRHDGGTGGYRSGGYTNNRTGGYNRGSQIRDNGGASSDRAIRQNDVIIKLLKEIRDRLPPPPPGTQQYDSAADTPQEPYKAEPSYQAAASGGDGASDDVSGSPGNGGNVSAPAAASADAADEEDKFNS